MSRTDLAYATVTELAAGLAAGQFSALELADERLARIAATQPVLNAFVSVDPDGARAAAKAADAARAKGEAGALTGIPIAHKDLFMAEGLRTTCSSKMLEHFVAPYDAHVVTALKQAGTVLLGKTAMDEFAMGSSTETSFFGLVRNPWQLDAVPGGSSGGAAVAVAAGLVPAATGSDTGGSIRQPSSFCGVTGIKPTYGICSRHGMVAFASSLDQAGPMARSAEDCALLLTAMAGHDARDATSLPHPKEDYRREIAEPMSQKPLEGIRIGLPDVFFGDGVDAPVVAAVEAALTELRALGAVTVPVALPNIGYSVPVYHVLGPAEASSNLSCFDGVRYGHRAAQYTDLLDMYKKTRAEGFGDEVKRRILIGTYVLSHGYYDAYYLKAQKVRRLIAEDYQAAFTQCDVILGPTVPTTAPLLGAQMQDPIKMYLNDIFTIGANLAGIPAMSVPCGFTSGGLPGSLPIGMQLQGPYFSEARLLNIAHRFQQATDWHQRTPKG
ncbi:MAG: Asp-tRNA(Asn)/Glu-tRNA(Gln) amidotransferase subunit GatA [Proteobacteria bacterium]|nr:Asp-tRNA(Asn)/Glu-tRNA(Gln) amidotransferase subunit GatA [Pseudomonadota bacterium]MCL2307541.1 Asp-tRNA(Asn)/Glu-tRNA(Gln) amidotransferase subunit GatA [Pseudomonadota bacterium]